jgi:Dockerin type I domain
MNIIRNTFLILGILAGFTTFSPASAQEPILAITSPSPNAIVQAGSTIAVSVTASIPLRSVMVIGEKFADVQKSTSQPFVVMLKVPTDELGTRKLTAIGIDTNGIPHFSAPINIDIEQDSLTGAVLTVVPSNNIDFKYQGDQAYVGFSLYTNDGVMRDVTSSSNLIISPQDNNIVSVRNNGLLIAVSPGKTAVKVNYKNYSLTINVSVPNAIPGDLNNDGIVDQRDLGVLQLYLNTTATIPQDARDLNHDGKINALDARILTTLCTYPRCATHP